MRVRRAFDHRLAVPIFAFSTAPSSWLRRVFTSSEYHDTNAPHPMFLFIVVRPSTHTYAHTRYGKEWKCLPRGKRRSRNTSCPESRSPVFQGTSYSKYVNIGETRNRRCRRKEDEDKIHETRRVRSLILPAVIPHFVACTTQYGLPTDEQHALLCLRRCIRKTQHAVIYTSPYVAA